jgi:hypothetical protein
LEPRLLRLIMFGRVIVSRQSHVFITYSLVTRYLIVLLSEVDHSAWAKMNSRELRAQVFLQHLSALAGRARFAALWLRVVEVQAALVAVSAPPPADDALTEAALESLKNMILVMDSVRVRHHSIHLPLLGHTPSLWITHT